MVEFFRRMTRTQKRNLALGVGGVAALVGIWHFAGRDRRRERRPDHGIRVNQLCTEYEVTNPIKAMAALDDVMNAHLQRGQTEPWPIASAFVARVAPHCRRHPQQMRSPGEALFNFNAFVDVIDELHARNLITATQRTAYRLEAQAWAILQGVDPSEFGVEGEGEPVPLPGDTDYQDPLGCPGDLIAVERDGIFDCECPPGTTFSHIDGAGQMRCKPAGS